jgi:hypothetical protein
MPSGGIHGVTGGIERWSGGRGTRNWVTKWIRVGCGGCRRGNSVVGWLEVCGTDGKFKGDNLAAANVEESAEIVELVTERSGRHGVGLIPVRVAFKLVADKAQAST